MLADYKIPSGEVQARLEAMRKQGQTVILVAVDGLLAGLLVVADPIRETTPEAIRLLKEDGVRVIVVTGDSRSTAEAVAAQLGLDEVIHTHYDRDASRPGKVIFSAVLPAAGFYKGWAQFHRRARLEVIPFAFEQS